MNHIFRPIDQWPRKMTPSYCRKTSPFKVPSKSTTVNGQTSYTPSKRTPLSQTYADLERELNFLKVKGDVITQVALAERDIRQDGRIRADARQPQHPGVLLKFEAVIDGKKNPLNFACDDCDNWQDNLRAIVKTLEHLRGADRYGVTKSGEQYRGWNALPPAGPLVTPPMTPSEAAEWLAKGSKMNVIPNDVLSRPDVYRDVYRASAKILHADRNNQIERPEWHTLQIAKAVLDAHHRAQA